MTTTRSARACCSSASTTPQQRLRWSELTKQQRTFIVAGAIVQLTLLATAQADISRRPADEIRGSKMMWRVLTFINFIGPIAYFLFGRKSAPTPPPVGDTAVETSAA
jgi:hypothetical protein